MSASRVFPWADWVLLSKTGCPDSWNHSNKPAFTKVMLWSSTGAMCPKFGLFGQCPLQAAENERGCHVCCQRVSTGADVQSTDCPLSPLVLPFSFLLPVSSPRLPSLPAVTPGANLPLLFFVFFSSFGPRSLKTSPTSNNTMRTHLFNSLLTPYLRLLGTGNDRLFAT
jgi:hypothetical protein